jgi:hypothetical protein
MEIKDLQDSKVLLVLPDLKDQLVLKVLLELMEHKEHQEL